jgi:DNA-3-methyladenine glycosylase II
MEKLEFKIGDSILQALCFSDKRLALLIKTIGDYHLDLRTDYFPSLIRSIIGQQLSVSVARTIWQRAETLCGDVTPQVITALNDDEFKKIGISAKKVSYLKDLSQKVLDGAIDLEKLTSLPDNEVIERLVRVKGIGRWTAEMFLIFSLGRLDILSLGDLGLKRAIQWLYGLKKSPAERTMKLYAKKWVPYRTVASLYLWEVINQGLIKESNEQLKADRNPNE